MKAVMIMFDSLNRNMLEPYGCDWVKTPNFSRLAEKATTFTNAFVGSMPCMPARRELHTGRYNFLHRSWGPLEPFDDSMPELLKKNGTYSHLISDHYHYWEDGGATYHTRYNSWEISRGQEGDPWKANLTDKIKLIEQGNLHSESVIRQDCVNRHYMQKVEQQPQSKTFALAQEFLHTNHDEDNWFLHIETFDPHEPYFVDEIYKKHYADISRQIEKDWVNYGKFDQTPEQTKHFRALNAALISMCDENLGKILDIFDKYDLWKDTLLMVNTDHGFLLGERQCWGKCLVPFYNEVAKIPLFMYVPKSDAKAGKCDKLVQTIDIAPTFLDFFGVSIPDDVQGYSLLKSLSCEESLRQAALFGVHGGHINITDGRYVYMRAAQNEENTPLYEYTLMPTNMKHFFKPEKLRDAVMGEPFAFTKDMPVMQVPGDSNKPQAHKWGTMLFDLETDPHQLSPIRNPAVELQMCELMQLMMKQNDAPKSQYERVGLAPPK